MLTKCAADFWVVVNGYGPIPGPNNLSLLHTDELGQRYFAMNNPYGKNVNRFGTAKQANEVINALNVGPDDGKAYVYHITVTAELATEKDISDNGTGFTNMATAEFTLPRLKKD